MFEEKKKQTKNLVENYALHMDVAHIKTIFLI